MPDYDEVTEARDEIEDGSAGEIRDTAKKDGQTVAPCCEANILRTYGMAILVHFKINGEPPTFSPLIPESNVPHGIACYLWDVGECDSCCSLLSRLTGIFRVIE